MDTYAAPETETVDTQPVAKPWGQTVDTHAGGPGAGHPTPLVVGVQPSPQPSPVDTHMKWPNRGHPREDRRLDTPRGDLGDAGWTDAGWTPTRTTAGHARETVNTQGTGRETVDTHGTGGRRLAAGWTPT
jgi:hypothetical protein